MADIPKTLRRDAHVLLWEKEHDVEATMRELHVVWAREDAYVRATNKDALIKNILLCRGSWAQQQVNLIAAREAQDLIMQRNMKARIDSKEQELADLKQKLADLEDIKSGLDRALREKERELHEEQLRNRDLQVEYLRLQNGLSREPEAVAL